MRPNAGAGIQSANITTKKELYEADMAMSREAHLAHHIVHEWKSTHDNPSKLRIFRYHHE